MDDTSAPSTDHAGLKTRALLVSVFTIGTCGLIYELIAGTIASYLLGDSVTQFSTIIGVYLFAMGVGSYLSRYFQHDLITRFIEIEILVGVVGGISSPVLFFSFAEIAAFRVVLYGWVVATGVLVGLEIPFLIRILEDQFPLRDLVSKVLSLDYLGALAASLLFPLWIVPQVGLMRSSFVFGVLNVLVAVWTCHLFSRQHRRPWLTAQAYGALAVLLLGRRVLGRPDGPVGASTVRGPGDSVSRVLVSADRADPEGWRDPSISQRRSAVLVRRRIPLPRSAGPSGTGGGGGAKPGAGAGRRGARMLLIERRDEGLVEEIREENSL